MTITVPTLQKPFKSLLLLSLLLINSQRSYALNQAEEIVFQESVDHLQISVDEGNVKVKGHDGSHIKVQFVKHNQDCRAEARVEDKVLKIKNDKKAGGCAGDYEIQVPSVVKVTVSSGASELTLDNLKADIEFDIGSGDVKLTDVSGNIIASVGAGSISYTPARSDKVRIFDLAAGAVSLNCVFPQDAAIQMKLEHGFIVSVDSSVKQVNDGSQDFVISGAVGTGSVVMSYSK